ncbi:acyl-CoA synthetase (AMP-forming)/AMP-acid ligase II [Inquilinus ginsengisoli]|uniref:AMP-binding protein n=1 Tax=Inquilinus ginsengisoli TaxID=363840 RepID=UPI003D2326B1
MATDPLPNAEDRCFSDILARRAAAHPGKDALIVVGTDGAEKLRLSYGELHAQVDRYAAGLIQRGLAGRRAMMLFEPGAGFVVAFMACLRAGVTALPCHLAKPGRSTWDRLIAIVRDSDAATILTEEASIPKLAGWFADSPELSSLPMLSPGDLDADPSDIDWRRPSADTPAFLQYTSGSTGAPKGTVVTFGNLIANAAVIGPHCGFDFDAITVCWLPPYHDLGLIGNILQSLLDGALCVLLPPVSLIQNPRRWLETITQYRATISMAPNFAYELCVRRIPAEKRDGLDLSSWRSAVNAAEPIRASTIVGFVEAYRGHGFRAETFRPVYGLAEATLMVSVGDLGRPARMLSVESSAVDSGRIVPASGPGSRLLVGSGKVRAPQRVSIVDPNSHQLCGEGAIGEVWVSGPCVAQGYWRRPEVSAQTFGARLADGQGPFLRTGDLGIVIDDELYITGRIKEVMIVNGRNIYPQDIEGTVQRAHDALKPAGGAVFSIDREDGEAIVVVQEIERSWLATANREDLVSRISEAVFREHDLAVAEVVLTKPETVPKTSAGKIQRVLCRDLYRRGELERAIQGRSARTAPIAVRPADGTSAAGGIPVLIARWAAGRGLQLPSAPGQTFAEAGFDSVSAVELTHFLETELELELDQTLLWTCTTVDSLSQYLAGRRDPGAPTGAAPEPPIAEAANW